MSPSMIVAMAALFFSLAGWGVAAKVALAPANSVGTQQIVNGSVRLADLHPSAVRLLKGQSGVQGEPGPQGATGAAGPAGGFDASKMQWVEASGTATYGSPGTITAACPSGTRVVSGGGFVAGGYMALSGPNLNGWAVGGFTTVGTAQIKTYAGCVSP